MKNILVKTLLPFLLGASAGAATINTAARGWYDAAGYASPNDVYQTGGGSLEHRSWFTFDLSTVLSPVSSASFIIFQPDFGFMSEDNNGDPVNATETFVLFDVASTGLVANGSGGHASIFTDLGTGTSYGSLAVTEANDGQYLSITLNSAFLAQLNANLGGSISLGGALAGMDSNPLNSRYLFNGSNTGNPADGKVSLQVTTSVPEPSGYGLFAGAAGLALATRRRIRNRRTR